MGFSTKICMSCEYTYVCSCCICAHRHGKLCARNLSIGSQCSYRFQIGVLFVIICPLCEVKYSLLEAMILGNNTFIIQHVLDHATIPFLWLIHVWEKMCVFLHKTDIHKGTVWPTISDRCHTTDLNNTDYVHETKGNHWISINI